MELVFITSNSAKLAHARHLCRDYSIKIERIKWYGKGYVEPRILNREKLLQASIEDAIYRWNKYVSNSDEKFFFIEDTSVIIPALSKNGKEVPGVDVKYWMRDNTFYDLDKKLKKAGNNRAVILKSHIVLALNRDLCIKKGKSFVVFEGNISGKIADTEIPAKGHPIYPWLSGNIPFNNWFIPQGCVIPLNLLQIEVADQKDFRAKSFNKMISFLVENKLVEHKQNIRELTYQTRLPINYLFLISGPRCSGKTTLSSHLRNKHHYHVVDVNDFIYMKYLDSHGFSSNFTYNEYSEDALKHSPSIVIQELANYINNLDTNNIVIIGFKSMDEIISFKLRYKGNAYPEILYIDSKRDERYRRNLNKIDYKTKIHDKNEFEKFDDMEITYGLKEIRENSAKIIINDDQISKFFKSFDDLYTLLDFDNNCYVSKKYKKPTKLSHLIIVSLYFLYREDKFYTTTEIAHLINNLFLLKRKKNKNNVSRFFNNKFYPFFDIKIDQNYKIRYRLSQTGKSYAKYIIKKYHLSKKYLNLGYLNDFMGEIEKH